MLGVRADTQEIDDLRLSIAARVRNQSSALGSSHFKALAGFLVFDCPHPACPCETSARQDHPESERNILTANKVSIDDDRTVEVLGLLLAIARAALDENDLRSTAALISNAEAAVSLLLNVADDVLSATSDLNAHAESESREDRQISRFSRGRKSHDCTEELGVVLRIRRSLSGKECKAESLPLWLLETDVNVLAWFMTTVYYYRIMGVGGVLMPVLVAA
jgi:hypothetical protein